MDWTCCLLRAAGSSFCHFERLVFLAGIFVVVVVVLHVRELC